MSPAPARDSAPHKAEAEDQGYNVTRWGAFWFCAGAFGAGMSLEDFPKWCLSINERGYTPSHAPQHC